MMLRDDDGDELCGTGDTEGRANIFDVTLLPKEK